MTQWSLARWDGAGLIRSLRVDVVGRAWLATRPYDSPLASTRAIVWREVIRT